MDNTTASVAVQVAQHLSGLVRSVHGRKLRRLRAALAEPSLSPCARELLEEELNFLLVRDCMGLSADRVNRQKICELIRQSNGELKIGLVARASPHLSAYSGRLCTEVSTADRHATWLQNTLGWLSVLGGLAILGSTVFFLAPGDAFYWRHVFAGLIGGTTLGVFGIFMLAQSDSVRVAIGLAPLLQRLQDGNAQDDDRAQAA